MAIASALTRLALLTLVFVLFLTMRTPTPAHAVPVYQTDTALYELGSNKLIYEGQVRGFGVSPDGETVVFSPWTGEDSGKILLADLEEETIDTISEPIENERSWSEVRFAPNGEEIIGVVDGDIYSIDINGDDIKRLVDVLHHVPNAMK